MSDAIDGVNDIHSQLSRLEYNIPNLTFDSHIHRFNRRKSKSGWYVAHMVITDSANFPIIVCGDWVTGEKHKVMPNREWNPRERENIKAFLERAQENEGKRREEKQAFAAELASELWELAEPSRDSSYMLRKGFSTNFGARVDSEGNLLVPMMIEDKSYGLQRIAPNGEKKFLPGQRCKGCYFIIGDLRREKPAYLCEGFATGASIYRALNLPVIIAFSASNLIEVAKHFHSYKIVIAADNDRFTDGNPGITAATKVAASCGFKWIAPEFCIEGKFTDFNDLHTSEGLDVVKKQLAIAVPEPVAASTMANKPGQKGPTKADIYRGVAEIINGISQEHQALAERFFVTVPEPGSFVLIEEYEPKTMRVVNKEHIVSCLIKHLDRHLRGWRTYALDVQNATAAVLYWQNLSAPILSPQIICQKSDHLPAFHRLPWDYDNAQEPTPNFDNFIGRCSNSNALKCFIGSLFEPLSDRSQYVWLQGSGGDGKGTLTTMLASIFGPTFCTPGIPSKGDAARFWTKQMHKKRLAVISECEDTSFLTSAVFKAITGNDKINFEGKGKDAICEKPIVKVFCTSNNGPQVTRGRDHKRRLISCYVKPATSHVADLISSHIMDACWWNEAPSIINKCIQAYRAACPTFGIIPTDEAAYDEAVEESEIYFDGIFENDFEVEEGAETRGAVLESWLDQKRLGYTSKRDFRKYLERKHGITSLRRTRGIVWISLKKRILPLSST